jgi:hypothetical protein
MKPRRDITLGEMQDECKRARQCGECEYKSVCMWGRQLGMVHIDLADPPRFNEQQMALLKAFKGVGAERVRVTVYGDSIRTFDLIDRFGNGMSLNAILGIGRDETLDLAELLGEDAT